MVGYSLTSLPVHRQKQRLHFELNAKGNIGSRIVDMLSSQHVVYTYTSAKTVACSRVNARSRHKRDDCEGGGCRAHVKEQGF